MSTFWNAFYEQPLDKIPWHKTQADYFVHLVESGQLKGESALDLGCGVGNKSIFLAQHGFSKVIGVDIAARAISYAKQNAVSANVVDRCSFYVHDATDLSFLPNKTQYDLVVDWAAFHCISESKREAYISAVLEKIKKGGYLLLRVFISEEGQRSFVEKIRDKTDIVSVFTKADILQYFETLEVVETNTSQPRTRSDLSFFEVLFKKTS